MIEVQPAANLRAGDLVYGVASARPWPEPIALAGVKREISGRILVDFGNGIVRRYEPGRGVWVELVPANEAEVRDVA